ncbi:Ig-like domain-containing protein [Marinobacter sp. V034]|uniref:Ig-like domain-containing protein n=1 Tax=Marinobacter sp. V034 TaxID=3459610 RepID=UPI0040451773
MKHYKLLALAPAVLLAACGGEEQTVTQPTSPGSVVYTFPADGQANVSPKADLVLRFSDAITDDAIASKVQVAPSGGGDPVSFSVTPVDNGLSLVLTPSDELKPGTEYTVSFANNLGAAGNRSIATPNATGPDGIQFTTRGSFSQVAKLANLSDTFEVINTLPDGDFFRFMDFSTIRLQTSQPIHPESAIYGQTVSLLDGEGELVPADLLVKGNNLTVDPCTLDDRALCGSGEDKLNPDETYTLSIAGLMNQEGDVLEYEKSFQPQNTGPNEVLYQKAVDSGFSEQSILNGQFVNVVTLNSVLQGKAGPSQQTGALYAELAYAPNFPGDTPVPLRVPKGTVLESTSLDVLVNGSVPVLDAATGEQQKTGTIKVTMISDASGYLYPNPYSDADDAPRHVRLWMDVSMNTEEAQPNASLSQDLLRVELSGIALVRDGKLVIDAIGMVEPNLLGQEYTDSTIAFRLSADTGAQDTAPERPIDRTAPKLVSWMPGPVDAIPATRQDMQRPGDPLVLNFDEPLDPETVASGLTLIGDGSEVPDLRTKVDGTTVAINPKGGLKHGVDYTLNIANSLTDIAGNGATSQDLKFALPPIDNGSVTQRPPLALTTYPGYPCETNFDDLDLNAGILGQCFDASGDAYSGGRDATIDTLPVSKMPADRPITVVFSQSMDPDSIRLGETFIVEKVSADSNGKPAGTAEVVSGRLEKNNQRIRFYPDKPWSTGDFYRYTMKSRQDPNPNTCKQGSPDSVCGVNGLALKTDLLEGLDDGGGDNGSDDLVIYFAGEEAKNTVFTPLRNLPIRDTNSNFIVDCNTTINSHGGYVVDNMDPNCLEPFSHAGSDSEGWAPSANSTKLGVIGGTAQASPLAGGEIPAQVGCEAGEGTTCPRAKFIYQTYGLNTEVKGPGTYDPTPGQPGDEVEGVLIDLYPTLLTTSSISVFTRIKLISLIPLQQETVTNTQVLRMRYAKDDPTCIGESCARNSLIPGVITEGEDGQPVFITRAELLLDAPEMVIPLGGTHDLYGRPFTLELKGDITFFDDGRMQIEQRNTNVVGNSDELMVTANTAGIEDIGLVTIELPLQIPSGGAYLNFISNPIKEITE